jgi:hypothetical protein
VSHLKTELEKDLQLFPSSVELSVPLSDKERAKFKGGHTKEKCGDYSSSPEGVDDRFPNVIGE